MLQLSATLGLPKALGQTKWGRLGATRDLVLGGHAAALVLALVLVLGGRCPCWLSWGRRGTARPRDLPIRQGDGRRCRL
eukprot:15448507-Alexandrium_andersonii.AAC.1